MDFVEWESYYLEILSEFGYPREEDERSARLFEALIRPSNSISLEELHALDWSHVSVLGDAPSLIEDMAKMSPRTLIITAGPATARLMEKGILPDIFVTDLDGPVEKEVEANLKGSLGVVHAHGDNMSLISTHARRFIKVLPTTQSIPFGRLQNFGGFTDGDRAVIMARHFGAKVIDLVGFDFENPMPKECSDLNNKKRKLRWAKKLIFEINPQDVIIRMV